MDLTWLYWLAGLAVLWIALWRGLTYKTVAGLRCRLPTVEAVGDEEIDDDLRLIISQADQALADLGFEFLCHLRIKPVLHQSGDDEGEIARIFQQAESGAIATVYLSSFWQLNNPTRVVFSTTFGDGHAILTNPCLSGLNLPLPSTIDSRDANTQNIAEQWRVHQARVAEANRGDVERYSSGSEYVEGAERDVERLAEFWLAEGILRRRDGGLAVSGRELRALSGRILNESAGLGRLALDPAQIPEAVMSAWDRQIIRRLVVESDSQGRWLGKLLFFIVSAVAFAVVFGLAFSWEMVPILLGVLLFHELGHLLAMKLTGYKDLHIFFVPMLGAAATGRKQGATALQQLFVYLMGPMPGLLLSMPLLWYGFSTGQEWVITLGAMAFVINYLNLLPITPLDGGRVLDTLLFSRLPRAQFVFAALSALALLAAGIAMNDKVLMVLGGIFAIGLPTAWQLGTVLKELQRQRRSDPVKADALALTTAALTSPIVARVPRAKRIGLARPVFQSAQIKHASPAVATVGMVIYLVCLLSPLLVVVGAAVSAGNDVDLSTYLRVFQRGKFERVTTDNWQTLLADATSDEGRVRILSRSIAMLEWQDPPQAQDNLAQAVDLAMRLPSDNKEVEMLFESLRYSTLDAAFKLAQVDKAIRHYEGLSPAPEIVGRLAWIRAPLLATVEERIAEYRRAIALLSNYRGEWSYTTQAARRELAQLHYAEGDLAETERLLILNTHDNPGCRIGPASLNEQDLLWFYAAEGMDGELQQTTGALLDRAAALEAHEIAQNRRVVMEPLMWRTCQLGIRSQCLELADQITAAWGVKDPDEEEREGYADSYVDNYSAFEQDSVAIKAHHLLGDSAEAKSLADELIAKHPEFKLQEIYETADYSKTGWDRWRLETLDAIANGYRIQQEYFD